MTEHEVRVRRVVNAARTYADFTHGNIRGPRYRARQEARDALLDALEALEDNPEPPMAACTCLSVGSNLVPSTINCPRHGSWTFTGSFT